MIDFKKEALEIKDEVVANRRYLHRNAEGGFDLPLTRDFVLKKLEEIGDEKIPTSLRNLDLLEDRHNNLVTKDNAKDFIIRKVETL